MQQLDPNFFRKSATLKNRSSMSGIKVVNGQKKKHIIVKLMDSERSGCH